MKKMKIALSLMLVLCLTFCVAGCSSNHDKGSLKDNLIDGFNSWMQSFSKHALTKEKDLQGEKEKGDDAYTGTYTATYDEFNGKEFIFGGTALERENGNQLKVTYTLTIEEAAKYFRIGEKKLRQLAEENPNANWLIMNGNRVQIKRKQFEKIIDSMEVI